MQQPEPDRPFQRPDTHWLHVREPANADEPPDAGDQVPATALSAVDVVRGLMREQRGVVEAELQTTGEKIEQLADAAHALSCRIKAIDVALALSDEEVERFIEEFVAAAAAREGSSDG